MKKILVFVCTTIILQANMSHCLYYSKNTKQYDLVKNDECISIDSKFILQKNNDAYISSDVLNNALYNDDNLSVLISKYGTFYVSKSGKVRQVLVYDNGADIFKNNLARTIRNEKIGFFDKLLNIKIKPSYDFAFPFKNNLSIVCNGCKKEKVNEHNILNGGKWGMINDTGTEVCPLIYNSLVSLQDNCTKKTDSLLNLKNETKIIISKTTGKEYIAEASAMRASIWLANLNYNVPKKYIDDVGRVGKMKNKPIIATAKKFKTFMDNEFSYQTISIELNATSNINFLKNKFANKKGLYIFIPSNTDKFGLTGYVTIWDGNISNNRKYIFQRKGKATLYVFDDNQKQKNYTKPK